MAKTGVFDHADNLGELGQGENLYTLRGPNAQVALRVLNYTDAVKLWYDEIEYYDFDAPGYSSKIGHFSQVMWKSTIKIGMAHSVNDAGNLYITARYSPPGNLDTADAFAENVL